jgi:hypothetical protein
MLHERFNSIDIVKGFIIVLILVINVLFLTSVPFWHEGMNADSLSAGLQGILYTGLLFMFGVTIPFAISKKINNGLTGYEILRHIFARSLILITVGVLMVNTTRVDAELTGFSRYIWSVLFFAAVFLVWNRYSEKDNNFFTNTGLRLLGLAILVFLVFKFKSGTYENNGSLIPGWWELPGLAGWGYLVTALTFLALRNSVTGTLIVWLFFLGLNSLHYFGMARFLEPVRPYFGIIVDGYIPSVVLAGSITGIILKKSPLSEIKKPALLIAFSSLLLGSSAVLLKMYIFPGGFFGNPAFAVISSAATVLFFIIIFWLDEIAGMMKWSPIIKQAGENALMAYIIQFLLFNLAWLTGADLFFFTGSENMLYTLAGSVVWALVILAATLFLLRINIRLKF